MPRSDFRRPVEILQVEDNAGDVRLAREALYESRIPNRVSVAPDGVEALSFLRREGCYATAPRPDLILLDLNLPKKDGREVLEAIKSDPNLRRIPVVVLTSSLAERDILGCYDRLANCYIAKPADLDEFLAVIKSIETFWLTIARLSPD